jgi:hypothetical protein
MKNCDICGQAHPAGDCPQQSKAHPLDNERFVLAGSVEDVLSAERYTQILEDAGIAVSCRQRRGGPVDMLTSANLPWWEIYVPAETLAKARALIQTEQQREDTLAEEAGRIAEEEERETETSQEPPESGRT